MQTDFPVYSQYQMPDNQTVSHLVRKMILIFWLWSNPGLNNFFEECIKFQSNK